MPNVDGLTAARARSRERDDLADVKVLVLTTFELDEYVYEALRAGASGFLVKHTEPAELIRAVRVVAAGDALLSPGVDPPPDRRVHRRRRRRRAAARTRRPRRRAADVARARRRGARRRGPVERGDRRAVVRQPGDRAHPRQPGDDEAERPRPRPARRVRLPQRARQRSPGHRAISTPDVRGSPRSARRRDAVEGAPWSAWQQHSPPPPWRNPSRAAPLGPDATDAVVVDALTKRFGDRTAVDHVSFSVPVGTVAGLIGPNGAGKTTIMAMLLGLVQPDERNGHDPRHADRAGAAATSTASAR